MHSLVTQPLVKEMHDILKHKGKEIQMQIEMALAFGSLPMTNFPDLSFLVEGSVSQAGSWIEEELMWLVPQYTRNLDLITIASPHGRSGALLLRFALQSLQLE